MDNNRFDAFAKLVAARSSRRNIIRGLLGLGGAAVAGAHLDERADARTTGTRPTVPPPPPPRSTTSSTTTPPEPECPAGQHECARHSCCAGTCTAAGRCCDSSSTVCGEECCSDAAQCCDGECCPDGTLCIGEEYCCPAANFCPSDPDNPCCRAGTDLLWDRWVL